MILVILSVTNLQSQSSIQLQLQALEDSLDVKIYYKSEWIKGKQLIINDFGNREQVLNQLSKSLQLDFIVRGDVVVFIPPQESTLNVRVTKSNSRKKIKLGSALDVTSDTVELGGVVQAANSAEAIPGVLISIDGQQVAVTDQYGQYLLEMTVGEHQLIYQSVGLEPTYVEIEIYGNSNLQVDMFESSTLLDEIVISEKKDQLYREPMASVSKMGADDLINAPMVLGQKDIMRIAVAQAGVNSIGEGASGFNVRGGQASQNQILLDEMTLYNPYHLFGFIPSFNPYLIDQAILYKGGIPASYGGWASSVFQTYSKVPSLDRVRASISAGLINGSADIEIPLVKDRLSLMVNHRRAYPNYLLDRYDDVRLDSSSYSFQDTNLRMHYVLNDTLKSIDVHYLSMEDQFALSNATQFFFENHGYEVAYKAINQKGEQRRLTLSHTDYGFQSEESDEVILKKLTSALAHTEIEFLNSKVLDLGSVLSYGAEYIHYGLSPGTLKTYQPSTNELMETSNYLNQASGIMAVHAALERELTEEININAGIRLSGQTSFDKTAYLFQEDKEATITSITDTLTNEISILHPGVEPRINVSYQYAPRASIKFSYQRSRQFINQINNSFAVNPIDLWTLSNRTMKPVISNRVVIGWFKQVGQDLDLTMESYYSFLNNVFEFRQGAQPYGNFLMESTFLQGIGQSYGFEVSLTKERGKLTGYVNYSFSRSFLKMEGTIPSQSINKGAYYPANYDIPHSLTGSLKWDVSREFDLMLNGNFQSGRPVTFPTSAYRLNDRTVLDFAERNNQRIPYYSRIDFAVNWYTSLLVKNKRTRTFWNFTVYNLTGRDNIINVFFEPTQFVAQLPQPKSFGIVQNPLFSLSYNIQFQ